MGEEGGIIIIGEVFARLLLFQEEDILLLTDPEVSCLAKTGLGIIIPLILEIADEFDMMGARIFPPIPPRLVLDDELGK